MLEKFKINEETKEKAVGVLSNVGQANLDSAATIAKLTAGSAVNERFLKLLIGILPLSAQQSLTSNKRTNDVALVVSSQMIALLLESFRGFIPASQHTMLDIAVESATLASAQAAVNAVDLESLISMLLGDDTAELVKDAVVKNTNPAVTNGNKNKNRK